MVLAVLTVLFSDREWGRAVSWVVIGIGAGLPLGPVISGYLLKLVGVDLPHPVMLLAVIAICVLLPESRDPRRGRTDLPGGLLSIAALILFVYAVIATPRRGWADPLVLMTAGVAVVLPVGFAVWELYTAQPMIDLRLFTRAQFAPGLPWPAWAPEWGCPRLPTP
jgi:MFS family permease